MIRKSALAVIAAGVLLVSGCTASGNEADPVPDEEESAAVADPTAETPADDPVEKPEEEQVDDDEEAQPVDGGMAAEAIASTIEEMGFECEEQERHLKIVSSAIECRADDYMFLTASQFFDAAERDSHFEDSAMPLLCGDVLGMSEVHWSVLDDWLLVPGGDRDKDTAAHAEASEKLGFELKEHICE